MKLATFAADGQARCGAVTPAGMIDLGARLGPRFVDLKSILEADALPELQEALARPIEADYQLRDIEWRPVIEQPGMIAYIGLNYEEHRIETRQEKTEHPTLFMRVPRNQIGHRAPLPTPIESGRLNYEGEIVVLIGKSGRRIRDDHAFDHVAGYSIYNNWSARAWQTSRSQRTEGANFISTYAFGPWMVTADEIPPGTVMTLETRLNGAVMQRVDTTLFIHSMPRLISYVSTFVKLLPGDVILTGTPSGVGAQREPPCFMKDGDIVEIEVDRIGTLSSIVRAEVT